MYRCLTILLRFLLAEISLCLRTIKWTTGRYSCSLASFVGFSDNHLSVHHTVSNLKVPMAIIPFLSCWISLFCVMLTVFSLAYLSFMSCALCSKVRNKRGAPCRGHNTVSSWYRNACSVQIPVCVALRTHSLLSFTVWLWNLVFPHKMQKNCHKIHTLQTFYIN